MGISGEQLLAILSAYNEQIWPLQWVAYLLGLVGLILAVRPTSLSNRSIPAVLAFFWLWVALLFWLPSGHQGFLPGYVLAAVYGMQGVLFLAQVWRPRMTFGYRPNLASWAGIVIALYALVGYPAACRWLNHIYPQAPPFGLTPCPLVTYTLGLLLLTRASVPRPLLIVPLLYAVSGFYWAAIGMVEDVGMGVSGLVGLWLIWVRDSRPASMQPTGAAPAPAEAGWSLDIGDKR
jgi:hypothetical protein